MDVYSIDKLMAQARKLAAEYRRATGQPLALSAEIAKHDACRLLDLEPEEEGAPGGYDAVGRSGIWEGKRIQVKGRAIFDEKKSGHRIGQLKLNQDWDSVMLVLMDEEFEPFEIYEAERADLEEAAEEAKNSRRANRGALSVARFKALGRLVWSRQDGVIEDEVWEHPGA